MSDGVAIDSAPRRPSLGVRLTGWVKKVSKNMVGSRIWKRRYFVLTHDSLIRFDRNTGDTFFGRQLASLDLLDIDDVVAVTPGSSDIPVDPEGSPVFMIRLTNKGKRYFCTKDEQECRLWVDAIKSEMELCKEEVLGENYKKLGQTKNSDGSSDSKAEKNTSLPSSSSSSPQSRSTSIKVLNISLEGGLGGSTNARHVASQVSWGVPIKLGRLEQGVDATVVIILSDGGTVRIHQHQLESSPESTVEKFTIMNGSFKNSKLAVRWHGRLASSSAGSLGKVGSKANLLSILYEIILNILLPLMVMGAACFYLSGSQDKIQRLVLLPCIVITCVNAIFNSTYVSSYKDRTTTSSPKSLSHFLHADDREWELAILSWDTEDATPLHVTAAIGAADSSKTLQNDANGNMTQNLSNGENGVMGSKGGIDDESKGVGALSDEAANEPEISLYDENGKKKSPAMLAFEKHKTYDRFMKSEPTKEQCLQRWLATEQWRRDKGIDTICDQPHPNLDTIKKYFPHYFMGRAKNGTIVYTERPGFLNTKALEKEGISVDDLVYHFMVTTEYEWGRLAEGEHVKGIYILDCHNISFWQIDSKTKEFLRRAITMCNKHYPERSYKIFIINTPSWFTMIWNFAKLFVNKRTQEKITINNKPEIYQKELLDEIDADILPDVYGGNAKFMESKMEQDFIDHMHKVTKNATN